LGTELARSYDLDHRKEEAIQLLDKIANGREPFDHQSPLIESEGGEHRGQRWPRVIARPVLKQLSKLTGNEEVRIAGLDEDICLAEIKGRGLRVFPGGGMEVLEPGRAFDQGRAVAGLVFPGRIPFAKGSLWDHLGSRFTCLGGR